MNTFSKKRITLILVVVGFVISAAIVGIIFPSTPQFKYEFQIGKPWNAEPLIAPFDFPIHKNEKELLAEQKELLENNLSLYYSLDENIQKKQLEAFTAQLTQSSALQQLEPQKQEQLKNKLLGHLTSVYNAGIASAKEWERILQEGKGRAAITQGQVSGKKDTAQFYSVVQAYRSFQEVELDSLEQQVVSQIGINNYIYPNMIYNEETVETIRKELIHSISLYRGKIKSGEVIINTKEVVNNRLFDILYSLKEEFPAKMGSPQKRAYILAGHLTIILFIFSLLFFYLYHYRHDILMDTVKVYFILANILITLVVLQLPNKFSWIPIYSLPIITLPILLRTFFDSRTSIFALVSCLLLAAGMVPTNSYTFILIQFFAGIIAVYSLKKLTKRSDLMRTSIIVFVCYSMIYTAISLTQEGSFSGIEWKTYIHFFVNAGFLLFTYPIIYIHEKIFGFVSDVTLMELSDSNRSLLQRLSEEAPGTFFHSLQIANLVQAAAIRIEANPLLARTGALYHDIGKLSAPLFFTENQQGIANPHNELGYEESAKIIINHVHEGVKLAKKNNLPKVIIDFISTHHGVGKAMYFYTSFKNENPNKEINEEVFTYPGPLPNSKETALVMMADSIEATSRSLESYTEENISEMVERIVTGQLRAGCFDYAPINFKEIQIAKEVFKEKLRTMYHTRVAYPKSNTPGKDS